MITALAFFSTPYITHKLGADQYGALCLLMTCVFAFSLLNLGMNATLVKRLAELVSGNHWQEMQAYLSTSLFVLVGIGVVITIVVFITANWIVAHYFRGPSSMTLSTVLAVRIASVAFVLQFLAQVISSIPAAVQRFDIINITRAGSEVLRILGTVIVLWCGFGLPSVMVASVCAGLCTCLTGAWYAKRLMPGLTLIPGFSIRHLRSLLEHSRYVLVVNFSNQLVGTADTFLIGLFLPVSNVAYYGIPYTLAQRLNTFIANLMSVVFPASSAFAGVDRNDCIKELYLRGMKAAFMAGCFPAFALCVFSRPFLLFWLGPEYAKQGGPVLSFLVLGFLINACTYVPYQVLQGTHYAHTAAKGAVFYGCANLLLFLLLIPKFGIFGASVAFLAAQLVFVPWFVRKSNQLLGIRWRTLFLISFARVFVVGVAACTGCWLFRAWVNSLFDLGILITAGAVIYLLLAVTFVLDTKERNACRSLVLRWIAFLPARA